MGLLTSEAALFDARDGVQLRGEGRKAARFKAGGVREGGSEAGGGGVQ